MVHASRKSETMTNDIQFFSGSVTRCSLGCLATLLPSWSSLTRSRSMLPSSHPSSWCPSPFYRRWSGDMTFCPKWRVICGPS
eukprot:s2938_g9.t1